METRARHLIVGFFVLALLTGLSGFVVWLGSIQITSKVQSYVIYFTGSVTGLQIGSPVRYQGVSVGRVSDIRIDPENTERVRVIIDVPEGTPVKADSMASLELQGITGFVYVQISAGGRNGSPPPVGPQGLPVIPSKPSGVETVFSAAPAILEKLMGLIEDAQGAFSQGNMDNLSQILANAKKVSDRMAAMSESFEGVTTRTQQTLDKASQTFDKASALIDTVQADAKPAMTNVKEMAASLRKSSDQIATLIHDNRDSIQAFTGTGLYEATLLVSDLRELVARLSRIAAEIEKDPKKAFFGPRNEGVKIQ